MGNLANKFLEAVNIISDAKTKSASFDRSVQVTIKKLYQEDSTKYEVEYEGALKTATGAAGYKTNDVVWAVVPRNDLTQTLQIIGLVSSIAADKQVLRSEDDKFEKITPNLATFETEWNLPYEDEDEEIQFIKTIWSATGSDNDNLITLQASKVIDAIKSSLYFEIGAIFESSINLNADTNFGIRCYCNGVTDKPKFVLDINDIIGNPYNLIGERQKKIFSITTDEVLESFDKIEFFAEGLSANDENDVNDDDKITLKGFSFYGCRDIDYMTGLTANLLVSETGTDFRELGGLSTNNYNLTTADNLIFKANLRYDGILVPENELSKYTYKWYLRTLENGLPIEIVIGDNPNTKDIVETWYFNKEESDDRIIPSDWFSIIEGAPNQLKLSAAALFMPNSWIQCEVIDEKGNRAKTVEGWIDNADKSYDLQLVVSTPEPNKTTGVFSSTLTIQPISGSSLPDNLIYKWFKDGNEMVDKDGLPIRSSSITILAEKHEYKCEVYTENNFLVFAETTNSTFIPNVPNTEKLSLSITGKSVYLCKADGEFIGQTENLKVWIYKEGKLVEDIADYKIEWSIPTKNTMLARDENSSLDQQELKFNVQKYLLNSYINNVISVNVSYEQENLAASSSVEITFLKNGQPGTNGTNIICYFADEKGMALQYYDNVDDITASNVVLARADGKTPPAIAEENIDIARITNGTDICLKATVSISGATYYAYLPIIKIKDGSALTLIEPSSAPYVQFSSGGNIAEDMPKIFTCSQPITSAIINSKYLDVTYSGNTFTLQVKENIMFKGDEVLPVININNENLRVPILLLTNRFEYAAINGWDGMSIKLDEENNTILAPMAGFGKKEEDNSFTGVVLGDIISDNLTTEEVDELPPASDADFNIIYKDKSQENSYYVLRTKDGKRQFVSSPPPDFQGIIGLNSGEQTFSLNANDGSAWFKGHIEATSGKIGSVAIDAVMPTNISGSYSWKFSPTDGLFMWNGAQDTDPLLKIDSNGLEISGKINATEGGNIGGFTINPTAQTLISGNIGMSANSSNYAFWAGHSDPNLAPFRVGHDGSIVAEKLQIDSGQVQGLFTIETLKSTDVTAENLKVKHLQGADGSFAGTLSGASGTFGTLKTNGSGALYYTSIGNGIYCGNQNSNSQTTGTVFCVNNSSQSQSIVGYWVQNTTDHKLPSKEVFLRGICVSGDDGGADTSGASGGVPHAYRGITRDWNVSGSAVLHIVSGIIVDIT